MSKIHCSANIKSRGGLIYQKKYRYCPISSKISMVMFSHSDYFLKPELYHIIDQALEYLLHNRATSSPFESLRKTLFKRKIGNTAIPIFDGQHTALLLCALSINPVLPPIACRTGTRPGVFASQARLLLFRDFKIAKKSKRK